MQPTRILAGFLSGIPLWMVVSYTAAALAVSFLAVLLLRALQAKVPGVRRTDASPLGPPIPHRGMVRLLVGTYLVLVMATLFLCWSQGFFDSSRIQSDVRSILAVLALSGTLLTGATTAIGLLLKQSIDVSTLMQQREAELRRAAEAGQAEARLRMDTCIRAVDLLEKELKEGEHSLRQAGALMALANLGQIDFALGLLDEVWAKDRIPLNTAVGLIRQGLLSDSPEGQDTAALLLRKHATRLRGEDGRLHWPEAAFYQGRVGKLSDGAQFWSLEALLRCLVSKPIHQWDPENLNEAAILLAGFLTRAPSAKRPAAAALVRFIPYLLKRLKSMKRTARDFEDLLSRAKKEDQEGSLDAEPPGNLATLLDTFEAWVRHPVKGSNSTRGA